MSAARITHRFVARLATGDAIGSSTVALYECLTDAEITPHGTVACSLRHHRDGRVEYREWLHQNAVVAVRTGGVA